MAFKDIFMKFSLLWKKYTRTSSSSRALCCGLRTRKKSYNIVQKDKTIWLLLSCLTTWIQFFFAFSYYIIMLLYCYRSQKLENVSIALEFLEREGITLVNIDSTDIVDCKLKLILGLIWTLILHYAISMPMWDGPPLGKKYFFFSSFLFYFTAPPKKMPKRHPIIELILILI